MKHEEIMREVMKREDDYSGVKIRIPWTKARAPRPSVDAIIRTVVAILSFIVQCVVLHYVIYYHPK